MKEYIDMNNTIEKMIPLDFKTYGFPAQITEIIKIAFIADFHDRTFSRIISSFVYEKPDVIL